MHNLLDFYYRSRVGRFPKDDKAVFSTKETIVYLEDNRIPGSEIRKALLDIPTGTEALHPDDLPDWLWKDSLVERGRFYFHRRLQIVSSPPKVDIFTGKAKTAPYFIEMRIRFTVNDLIEYCRRKLHIRQELQDNKRDKAAVLHLLERYRRIEAVAPLDFMLFLADHAERTGNVRQIVSLSSHEAEVLEEATKWKNEAHAKEKDRIVWRMGEKMPCPR